MRDIPIYFRHIPRISQNSLVPPRINTISIYKSVITCNIYYNINRKRELTYFSVKLSRDFPRPSTWYSIIHLTFWTALHSLNIWKQLNFCAGSFAAEYETALVNIAREFDARLKFSIQLPFSALEFPRKNIALSRQEEHTMFDNAAREVEQWRRRTRSSSLRSP